MMALQSIDGLKIREDPVQKNKGATIHTNNMHYNKYVTVKTHPRIISDGLTIKGSSLSKNLEPHFVSKTILKGQRHGTTTKK